MTDNRTDIDGNPWEGDYETQQRIIADIQTRHGHEHPVDLAAVAEGMLARLIADLSFPLEVATGPALDDVMKDVERGIRTIYAERGPQ